MLKVIGIQINRVTNSVIFAIEKGGLWQLSLAVLCFNYKPILFSLPCTFRTLLGYAIIEKLPNDKNAKALARVVNRSLAYFKRMGLLHSITTDNGSEFMAFRSIERALRVPVFFAKPYCSTDKPHVELLNKLIRQYIPKGTSFKDIDDKQIRNIRRLLNNRPRKSLDFKSPNEVLALLFSYRCTWYWNLQALITSSFVLHIKNVLLHLWCRLLGSTTLCGAGVVVFDSV